MWDVWLRWGSGLEGGMEEYKEGIQNFKGRWNCQGFKGTFVKDDEIVVGWI